MKSKERILFEAFKLYSVKSYTDVTFSDLEVATNLSRGAILFHFKKKEEIFKKVIESYIFSRSSIATVEDEYRQSLYSFIKRFVEQCKIRVAEGKEISINNINLAMLHLESSGFNYYPGMQKKAKEWYENELSIWKKVITDSIESKELKEDVDADTFSRVFEDLYLGTSFVGITRRYGLSVENLEKNLLTVYNSIKA